MDKLMIGEFRYDKSRNHYEDNDIIDRLNGRYTVLPLMMAFLAVTYAVVVGGQISCWMPYQLSSEQISYIKSVCWMNGSYYLPTAETTIPDRSQPRKYYVSYYQWTPFIFIGMALLFLIPQTLWHAYGRKGSVDIQHIVHALKGSTDCPDKVIQLSASVLKQYILYNEQKRTKCCSICGERLTVGFFMSKALYIINTTTQFVLLNAFLSFQFTVHGSEVVGKFIKGVDWFESPRFPRVTMCDVMVRHLGSNQHWYAIQCSLPYNIYNEKIFFILWIWLLILTILNVFSTGYWIYSLQHNSRLVTIRKYLNILDIIKAVENTSKENSPNQNTAEANDSIDAEKTVESLYLDGYLILRLIAHNTDSFMAAKFLCHIMKKQNNKKEDPSSSTIKIENPTEGHRLL